MRAYVLTTGALFAVITIAHLWRMVVERSVAADPFYILLTVLAAFLSLWAAMLLRRAR